MPSHDTLDIHLRRRFIERAQAQRPRLPGNLHQLGAVGTVTRPQHTVRQPVIVKVGITKATTTGQHLSYLQHGKGPDGQRALLFGPGAAQPRPFVQSAYNDPHQFRLVVSPADPLRLDRTRYIELFMAQVERDLNRPLTWVAAHHYDTAHPHTHIVVRGTDLTGKTLYMQKHYMTQGLRDRAAQLLTWLVGPAQQRGQAQQTIQTERQTLNGISRGADDPDTRTKPLSLAQRAEALREQLSTPQGRRTAHQQQGQGQER